MKSLFKTLFTLPRWITFPAVVGALIGLTAACYPGGLSAAYADVRDVHRLNAQVDECQANERQMGHTLSQVRDRLEYKEELVSALIRGQTTLAAVTDQFAEAHRGDERALMLQRGRFGNLPDRELVARTVLDFVHMRTAPEGGSSVATSRVRAEFEQLFGHPAPRD